jgi:hypothetical protein
MKRIVGVVVCLVVGLSPLVPGSSHAASPVTPLYKARLDATVKGWETAVSPMGGDVDCTPWWPASAQPASLCVGSLCLGSLCAGSLCISSECSGSLCVASGCAGSGCVGSTCLGSGCVGSICGGSVCVGTTMCLRTCGGITPPTPVDPYGGTTSLAVPRCPQQ